MNWIKTSERLPDKYSKGEFLVCVKSGGLSGCLVLCHLSASGTFYDADYGGEIKGVTHWMEIEEPREE